MDSLPAFEAVNLAVADRPPAEFAVTSAALGCPDLFLLGRAADADRLRAAAELAVESAHAGERVLVLTGRPCDVSDLLTQVVDRTDSLVGRALAPGEYAFARTAQAYCDDWLAAARSRATATCAAAEHTAAGLQFVPALIDGLREMSGRIARIAAEEAGIRARPDDTHDTVAAEAGTPFAVELSRHASTFTAKLEQIDAASGAALKSLAGLRKESSGPSKSGGLSGFFKGMFAGRGATAVLPAVSIQELEATVARLAAERIVTEKDAAAGRQRLINDECARRTRDRSERLAGLAADRLAAEAEFRAGRERLAVAGLGDAVVGELDSVADAASKAVSAADAAVRIARECAEAVAVHGSDRTQRSLGLVRIVVGSVSACGHDPFLAADGEGFDRVVVADAEGWDDSEITAAISLGPKCVLIGATDLTPGHGTRARPATFQRLWQQGHRPRWADDDGRLVAWLGVADPLSLRSEPLADQPEITLRFGRDTNGEMVLAAVVFAPHWTAADAKTFLAVELGEVWLAPCGPVRWHDAADRLTACWPAADAAGFGEWVDVAPGVREKVVDDGPGGWTAAVSFDPAAGWDRDGAAGWVARRATPSRALLLPRTTPVPTTPLPAPFLAGVVG